MPYKPGRGVLPGEMGAGKARPPEELKPLAKLRTVLNQTKTSTSNNPLYQYLNSLLEVATRLFYDIFSRLSALEDRDNSNNTNTDDNCCCEPLTNGDIDTPELIFASGDVIMCEFTTC